MDSEMPIETRFPLGHGTCLDELDASSIAALSRAAVRRTYAKGQIVCLEKEPCPGLIIIESGWLSSAEISSGGREQEIRLAGPGEMMNEISVLAGDTNLVTLKCVDHAIIWVIEREKFFHLMADHPKLANVFNRNLVSLVVQLLNIIEDLSLRNVEGRLARLLLKRSRDGIIYRPNWSTQEEMAACIGTTSVVVSRVLNEMQDQGAIHLERRQIHILNHRKLESVAYLSDK